MADSLRIEFDRPDRTYAAGDIVHGRVVVETDRGDRCEDVRLARYWKTHGKGNSDTGDRLEATIHRGPLQGTPPFEIPFEVATVGRPFTYRGHYLKVDHYLEARVDIPWAIDPKVREDFLLVPGEKIEGPPARLVYAKRTDQSTIAKRVIGVIALVLGVFTLPFGLFFILFGVLFLGADVRKKLAGMKLGDVTTRLEPRVVEPGGETRLTVTLRPQTSGEINAAEAELRATEVCVSGSGTDKKTHRHELHSQRIPLAGAVAVEAGREQTLEAVIPVPDVPAYSFVADRNSVVWEVVVHLDIPAWPDWKERETLTVWPGGWREGARWTAPPEEEAFEEAPVAIPEAAGEEPDTPAEDPDAMTVVADDPPRDGSWTPETPASSDASAPPPPVDAAPTALPPLAQAIEDIRTSSRFGQERPALIEALVGSTFDFEMTVQRVDRSFGVRDPAYRNGRTAVGAVTDTDFEVEVLFPESAAAELDALERGSRRTVRATVASWDRLGERPVLHAAGDPGESGG